MIQNKKETLSCCSKEGIAVADLMEVFRDEDIARHWFESIIWKDGKAVCHRFKGTNTYEAKNRKPLPYRCRDCRKHFSMRHGKTFEGSHIPLRKWAIAIYMIAANPKSVSSMKLHRELDITKKSAWHMLKRIRDALTSEDDMFHCEVKVDEIFPDWLDKINFVFKVAD